MDVAQGHYEILGLGPPARYGVEYDRLLRERYGIECKVVAGSPASSDLLLEYTMGYNEISMDAANRRFGHNVFKECIVDGIKVWKSKRHVE